MATLKTPTLTTYSLTRNSNIQLGALVAFKYRKENQLGDENRVVVVTGVTSNLIQGHDLNRETEFRAFKRSRITSDITLLGRFTSPV